MPGQVASISTDPTPSAEGSRSRAASTSRRTSRATRASEENPPIADRVASGLRGKERGRDVALTGVRQDHDDPLARELRPRGELQRAGECRAAGDPGEETLL